MSLFHRARLFAGAFLLLAVPLSAERLQIAAQRTARDCPDKGPPLGIVTLEPERKLPEDLSNCIVQFQVEDASDEGLREASAKLSRLTGVAGVVLNFSFRTEGNQLEWIRRIPLAIKQLSSAVRSASPQVRVALDLSTKPMEMGLLFVEPGESLSPYFDALASRAFGQWVAPEDESVNRWLFVSRMRATAVDDLLYELKRVGRAPITLLGVLHGERQSVTERDWESLRRLQAYWTEDVSRDRTPTKATRADGSSFDVPRFFDAKKFTPILLLADDSGGGVALELSGGTYLRASVENLATGGRRDFNLPRGAKALTLDLSFGPLAAVLHAAARPGGETRAAVEVEAVRGLTAEEIVARERAWDAGQRERLKTFVADMEASLRFRVAEVNETFDPSRSSPCSPIPSPSGRSSTPPASARSGSRPQRGTFTGSHWTSRGERSRRASHSPQTDLDAEPRRQERRSLSSKTAKRMAGGSGASPAVGSTAPRPSGNPAWASRPTRWPPVQPPPADAAPDTIAYR